MKNIRCPYCKITLQVTEEAANKDITCPKCKHTIPYLVDENGTEVRTVPNSGKLYRPGKLELLKDDGNWLQSEKTVTLVRGVNTLGRKSPNSTSSIQLPTTDTYMSKNHAKIEVVMKPDAVFVHHLSDAGSKNGTYHNDDRLEEGELIILTPGDTVRMGHSTFKFIAE